jgi:hypothetical protein
MGSLTGSSRQWQDGVLPSPKHSPLSPSPAPLYSMHLLCTTPAYHTLASSLAPLSTTHCVNRPPDSFAHDHSMPSPRAATLAMPGRPSSHTPKRCLRDTDLVAEETTMAAADPGKRSLILALSLWCRSYSGVVVIPSCPCRSPWGVDPPPTSALAVVEAAERKGWGDQEGAICSTPHPFTPALLAMGEGRSALMTHKYRGVS